MVARMSDEELDEIILNYKTYQEELVQAVVWAKTDKDENCRASSEVLAYIDSFLQQKEKEEALIRDKQQKIEEAEQRSREEQATPLFSQSAILGFSLFFSPISAGILLSLNLKRLQRKGIPQVMLFALVFTLFQGYVSMKVQTGGIMNLVVNVAGALIMSELLWKQYIGNRRDHPRRSIIVPLLICIVLLAPLAWYIYQNPEWLETATP
jgi:hypothetical protein